jgi:hypothetical protein
MAYLENTFLRLRKVLEDPELTPIEKNVFTALMTFAGGGKIFPGREQICKRLGIKRMPTISQALGRLKERGYISIQRRHQKSSFYEICGVTTPIDKVSAAKIDFPKC